MWKLKFNLIKTFSLRPGQEREGLSSFILIDASTDILNGLPEIFGIEGRVNFNVNFNGLLFTKKNKEKLTKFCLHKMKKIL